MEGRVAQKYLKTWGVFGFFAIWANWPTRGYMMDFLLNLAFNLRHKTYENPTQEVHKIEQKRHRKYDAGWLGIRTLLGTDLVGFWRQIWSQVGTK